MNVPDAARDEVEQARAAAASRSGIPSSEWQAVDVRAVDWPDPSLGCPEPGKFYTQVITPGYLIHLGARATTVEYHTGGGRVIPCDRGAPSPGAKVSG